jgi:fatty-acyl-CoA synthase
MAAMLRTEPGYEPARLQKLTGLFTGGAPLPVVDAQAWLADDIGIVNGYGMSETGTVFGMPLDPNLIAAKAGAAGIAMPGIKTRIVDPSGHDCPPGMPGELLVKGDNVFSAYWRRPAETEAAFTADGWFRTGDIVTCDLDGFHSLVDRKKDMFISGGENIYPAEIEVILALHPDIAECAVIGVPDAKRGEVGHAVVVARSGAVLRETDIIGYLEPRIARYKLPKSASVVASLPRTGPGKIKKAALRELFHRENS